MNRIPNIINNIKLSSPKNYREMRLDELSFLTETNTKNKFLKSHKDIKYQYYIPTNEINNNFFKNFYIKSFFGSSCEGPSTYAHGGLSASILDEAMGINCWYNNYNVVTKELNVKYNYPIELNKEIHGEAYITNIDNNQKDLLTYSKLFYDPKLNNNKILVEATGLFRIVRNK